MVCRPLTHLQCVYRVVEKYAEKVIHRPSNVHKPLKGGKFAYYSLTVMKRFAKVSHKPTPD